MIEVTIPGLRTISPNQHGHWLKEAARKKKERQIVMLTFKAKLKKLPSVPVMIVLIREAIRPLDEGDNLPSSFKCIRDAIAKYLLGGTMGENDDDPRLVWKYRQEKAKKYGIRIEFHELEQPKGD